MEKLNRPDLNTKEYWDKLYDGKERKGWWINSTPLGSVKTFMGREIEAKINESKLKFIEIGGGNGAGASIIKSEFTELDVYNLDISNTAIKQGSKKFSNIKQVCFNLNNNIDTLGLNNKFDIVLCQETIEHLNNMLFGIEQIMKLLKIGGIACFSFPNNEKYTGGAEHLWTFDHNSIPILFYTYTNEVTVCNFRPFGKNPHLHLLTKFVKTK